MLQSALIEAAENNPMWSNQASCTKLANTMLDIYDGVKRSFRPDDYRHYQFTPRNLTEWVQGLQRLAMGVEVCPPRWHGVPLLGLARSTSTLCGIT